MMSLLARPFRRVLTLGRAVQGFHLRNETTCSRQRTTANSRIMLNSGYEMPVIGLGTLNTDDLESALISVETALDCGYRYIDTAFAYMNEVLIGLVLLDLFKSGKYKREDLFITSKLPVNGMRPQNAEYFFRMSLLALHVDYIDMYLIHNPVATKRTNKDLEFYPHDEDNEVMVDHVDLRETWSVLENLVLLGGINSIGLSNCNSRQIQKISDSCVIKPANLQVECHPYLPQNELYEFCKGLNIAFTAYSPLGAPGIPDDDLQPGEPRLFTDERLVPIAEKHGKSVAQVLLRFQTQRGIIPIPRSIIPGQIEENIKVFDFDLDQEDLRILRSMENGHRYFAFNFSKSMIYHPENPFTNTPF